MAMFETLRKTMLAGFGAQEKVKEAINELVKKGELSKSQGAKLAKEWTEKARRSGADFDKAISDAMKKTLEKINIPTRDDIDRLNKKIQFLSNRVKKLEGEGEKKEE